MTESRESDAERRGALTSGSRARAIVVICLAGLAAGVALWLVADVVSRTNISGDGWSLRGNGALIVPFLGLPAAVVAGWVTLLRSVRRGGQGGLRWLVFGLLLVPLAVFGGFMAAIFGAPLIANRLAAIGVSLP